MQYYFPSPLSPCVRIARKYIDDHYSSIHSLADVVEETGMNYSTLRQKFRRETGQTLQDYLISVRIRTAVTLLLGTDMMAKEICWKVGIKDEAYFGKIFHEQIGITMREYRRLIKKGTRKDIFKKIVSTKK